MIFPMSREFRAELESGRSSFTSAHARFLLQRYSPFQIGLLVSSTDWFEQFVCMTPKNRNQISYSIQTYGPSVFLRIADFSILVDPNKEALSAQLVPELIVVTHIHNDHIEGLLDFHLRFPELPVLMSDQSWKLLALRDVSFKSLKESVGISISSDGTPHIFRHGVIKAFPAGHLLGAAMFHFEYSGVKILVSGDFALRPLAGDIVGAWPQEDYDYVLLDATHLFDDTFPTVHQSTNNQSILDACHDAISSGYEKIIFASTALGPAQEVLATIAGAQRTGAFSEFQLVVDGLAHTVTDFYRQHLGSRSSFSRISYETMNSCNATKKIIITSTQPDALSSLPKSTVLYNGIDSRKVANAKMYTTYAHASSHELLCTALAISTTRIGLYQCRSTQSPSKQYLEVLQTAGRSFDMLSTSCIQGV